MSKKTKGEKLYKKGQIGMFVSAICEEYKLEPATVAEFLLKKFPELKKKEKCVNCEANMAIYEYKIDELDALLIFGMGKIVGNNLKKGLSFTEANKVHLQTSLNTYYSVPSRSTQCSKLGLIAKVMRKSGKDKNGKTQYVHDTKAGWCLTDRGFAFLAGKPVPYKVQSFRNKITERFEETITIGDIAKAHSELGTYTSYPFDQLENYSVSGFAQGVLL